MIVANKCIQAHLQTILVLNQFPLLWSPKKGSLNTYCLLFLCQKVLDYRLWCSDRQVSLHLTIVEMYWNLYDEGKVARRLLQILWFESKPLWKYIMIWLWDCNTFWSNFLHDKIHFEACARKRPTILFWNFEALFFLWPF